MEKFANGLSKRPGSVSSLTSRVVCATCWTSPDISKATYDKDSGMVSFTACCHGKKESHTIEKAKLARTFKCFENGEGESDEGPIDLTDDE
jgi:hypothetical protein